MAQIGHSKPFWTTSVGKSWKTCKIAQNAHYESFWTTVFKVMISLVFAFKVMVFVIFSHKLCLK